MTNQNNPLICGDCGDGYAWSEDPSYGIRCLLFDSVDPNKTNSDLGFASPLDFCRYSRSAETTRNGTKFTREEVAEIVNRAPRTLTGRVTAADISPRFGLILKNS